jgi:hypothetical protein
LLNACDATRGSRLVIGFPSLPQELWSKEYAGRKNSYEKPQTLSWLCPDLELSLSRAVRLSSNFPWGLRVQNLPGRLEDHYEPLHVLDGGVVDNTGLDTIYALFDALRFHAQEPPRSRAESKDRGQPTYPTEAKEILDELWKRDVVIVEVDAGAKPDLQVPHRSVAYLLEPSQSLTNASYTNGALTRKFYIDETSYILTPPEKRSSLKGSVFSVTLACNHYRTAGGTSHDVMTAWALGPEDKAQVLFRFLIELKQWEFQWTDMVRTLPEEPTRGRKALDLLKEANQLVDKLANQKRKWKKEELTTELNRLEKNYKEIVSSLGTLKKSDEVRQLQEKYDVLRAKSKLLFDKPAEGVKKTWDLEESVKTIQGYLSQIAQIDQELKKEVRKSETQLQERLDRRAKFSRDAFDRPPTRR